MTETNSPDTAAVETPRLDAVASEPASYIEKWCGMDFKIESHSQCKGTEDWHFHATQVYPLTRDHALHASGIRECGEGEYKWFVQFRNCFTHGPTFQSCMDKSLKKAAQQARVTIKIAEEFGVVFSAEEDGE